MRVAVLGAYGYTGRLICRELKNLEIELSCYGRNFEKLAMLQKEFSFIKFVEAVDLRQEADVANLIAKSDIVINCAGPFTEEASVLLNRVASSGKTYIDITGELQFVRDSKERHHARAIKYKSLIIHACAFECLLVDLAMVIIGKQVESIRSVNTFYQFSDMRVSPGTKMTMKLAKYRKLLKIVDFNWSESSLISDQKSVTIESQTERIALPYPLPEIAFSLWNYNVKTSESFLLLEPSDTKFFPGLSRTKESALNELDRIRLNKGKGPNPEIRSKQECEIVINVIDEKCNTHNMLLCSKDMYLLTAKAIGLSLQVILSGKQKIVGVVSPAKLFANQESKTLSLLKVSVTKNIKATIEQY